PSAKLRAWTAVLQSQFETRPLPERGLRSSPPSKDMRPSLPARRGPRRTAAEFSVLQSRRELSESPTSAQADEDETCECSRLLAGRSRACASPHPPRSAPGIHDQREDREVRVLLHRIRGYSAAAHHRRPSELPRLSPKRAPQPPGSRGAREIESGRGPHSKRRHCMTRSPFDSN